MGDDDGSFPPYGFLRAASVYAPKYWIRGLAVFACVLGVLDIIVVVSENIAFHGTSHRVLLARPSRVYLQAWRPRRPSRTDSGTLDMQQKVILSQTALFSPDAHDPSPTPCLASVLPSCVGLTA